MGLSLGEFAKKYNVDKSWLYSVERKKITPSYTKVKDLFEEQGIDRKSLTTKAIESEVNRCMKLGLNKICLDERLVPLLGSQD